MSKMLYICTIICASTKIGLNEDLCFGKRLDNCDITLSATALDAGNPTILEAVIANEL